MLLCSIALAIPYFTPRSQKLSSGSGFVGYYKGLGFIEGRGYFGKNWYRMVRHFGEGDDLDGYCEIEVDRLGYNSYRGYYATGVLREEGRWMVAANGSKPGPAPFDIQQGKYFNPSGELISEIKNGTGTLIQCYANGQPYCSIDFEQGEMTHVKRWHDNGQLHVETPCRNGKPHGALVKYFPNGQIECQGQLLDGKRAGVFVRFSDSGKVVSELDYGFPASSNQSSAHSVEDHVDR